MDPAKCRLAGDPIHEVINVRKAVSLRLPDTRIFLRDTQDAILRWTRATAAELGVPDGPGAAHEWSPLSEAAGRCLADVVQTPDFSWSHDTRLCLPELGAFLRAPWTHLNPEWLLVLPDRGLPPRKTVERAARVCGVQLHPTVGPSGWGDDAAFLQELDRLLSWYSPKPVRRLVCH